MCRSRDLADIGIRAASKGMASQLEFATSNASVTVNDAKNIREMLEEYYNASNIRDKHANCPVNGCVINGECALCDLPTDKHVVAKHEFVTPRT